MPYSLRGKSVVRSDTGEVVKTHPTRERALRHLRALKANVQESSPAVLGTLLEGLSEAFGVAGANETPQQSMAIGARDTAAAKKELSSGKWNAAKHPRGGHGRFGYTTGGKRAKRASSAHSATLHAGSSGALVRSLQKLLAVPQDGKYGPQTRAAVMRFQTQHGLLVDGIVGRQTLAALRGRQGARKLPPGPIASKAARVAKPRAKKGAARAPVRMAGGLKI